MKTTQTIEYAVRLSQRATNGTQHWQAFVETLPQIQAEGDNCEGVLEEIGRKLQDTLAVNAPVASPELAALEAQVQAQGHKFYGIFADDPSALDVFDEIERLRDQETIDPSPAPSAP